MLFGENRSDLRAFYVTTWQKAQKGLPLEPLEQMISNVIADHPEYHAIVSSPASLHKDFSVDDGKTNPFLHMGLHIAILEQVATDRPQGIRLAYEALLEAGVKAHDAEHKIIDCLAESLWQAQQNQLEPDETAYLAAVKDLVK